MIWEEILRQKNYVFKKSNSEVLFKYKMQYDQLVTSLSLPPRRNVTLRRMQHN